MHDVINQLLEEEADELVNVERYERAVDCEAYRIGHCESKLVTPEGEVVLHASKLRGTVKLYIA